MMHVKLGTRRLISNSNSAMEVDDTLKSLNIIVSSNSLQFGFSQIMHTISKLVYKDQNNY